MYRKSGIRKMKHTNRAQSEKTKFRRSSKWLRFRKSMKAEQKFDPVTGSRLGPTCNVHHLDLNEDNYKDLGNRENFVCLNTQTHEVVHWLWQAHGGWRNAVYGLIRILRRLEQLNRN